MSDPTPPDSNSRRGFLKKTSGAIAGAAALQTFSCTAVTAQPESTEGKFQLGDYKLDSGVVLANAILGYETHGELNADRSNVILYPTWYTGRHMDNRAAIGEGRALDPTKYFIIVPDMFGNGLSSSPTNTPSPHDRGRFPLTTTYDNIRAQKRLCEEVWCSRSPRFVGQPRLPRTTGFIWKG